MRITSLATSLALGFLLMGCAATGPKLSEADLPQLKPDHGRIFFYRSNTVFGAVVQADIVMNGRVVGRSERGGFFYIDDVPGNKEVSVTSEVERRLTFTLEPGQRRYVRTQVVMGTVAARIHPELVDDAIGQREMYGTSYIGTAVPR
jgi:hypothetical protein